MTRYAKTSPYAKTKINAAGELGLLSIRSVPEEDDDLLYTIESQYMHRPDLLAFDLYGSSKLWWVFIQRNMEVLEDPIYDFIPGKQIYLPKNSKLKQILGI